VSSLRFCNSPSVTWVFNEANRSKCMSIARTRARKKVRFRISLMHRQEPDLQGMQQAVVSNIATMPAITSDASILFVYHLIDNENELSPDTF
jgi:hypothetical protein